MRVARLLDDVAEELRRDGEVEGVVAAGAAVLVELADRAGELVERVVVVETALDEAEPVRQLLPDLLGERRAGVLLDGVVDDLGEVLTVPVAAGEADDGTLGGEVSGPGQLIERRHELAVRQVAGRPEQDDDLGWEFGVHACRRSGHARKYWHRSVPSARRIMSSQRSDEITSGTHHHTFEFEPLRHLVQDVTQPGCDVAWIAVAFDVRRYDV